MSSAGFQPASYNELEKLRAAYSSLNDIARNLANAIACTNKRDLKMAEAHLKAAQWHVRRSEEIDRGSQSHKACLRTEKQIDSRAMKILTLLLIMLLTPQAATNQRISTKYDRFADTTALVLTDFVDQLSGIVDLGGGSYAVKPGSSSSDVVLLHVIAVSAGRSVRRDASIAIGFTSQSKNWIYLRQTNTLRMILDSNERLNLGTMARTNSEVLNGGVMEQIAVKVSLDVLSKIANAKKVEVQLGQDEFEMTKEQLSDLRDYVSRFPPR